MPEYRMWTSLEPLFSLSHGASRFLLCTVLFETTDGSSRLKDWPKMENDT
jgi:hypothetical protein